MRRTEVRAKDTTSERQSKGIVHFQRLLELREWQA